MAVVGGNKEPNQLCRIRRAGPLFHHPNLAPPASRDTPQPRLLHFSASTNGLARVPGFSTENSLATAAIRIDCVLCLVTLDGFSQILPRRPPLAGIGGMPPDVTAGADCQEAIRALVASGLRRHHRNRAPAEASVQAVISRW